MAFQHAKYDSMKCVRFIEGQRDENRLGIFPKANTGEVWRFPGEMARELVSLGEAKYCAKNQWKAGGRLTFK
jgi:hypothetical protein